MHGIGIMVFFIKWDFLLFCNHSFYVLNKFYWIGCKTYFMWATLSLTVVFLHIFVIPTLSTTEWENIFSQQVFQR